jgi:hypothetical protein
MMLGLQKTIQELSLVFHTQFHRFVCILYESSPSEVLVFDNIKMDPREVASWKGAVRGSSYQSIGSKATRERFRISGRLFTDIVKIRYGRFPEKAVSQFQFPATFICEKA